MEKELKAKWITEMRSGKYLRMEHQLKSPIRENCFCPLGLLALIINPNGFDKSGMKWKSGTEKDEDINSAALIDPVASGISVMEQDDIVYIFDKQHKSFEEVADYVEANL